jgi:hypothetical protein
LGGLPPVCVKMVVADRRADHLVHFVERLGRRKVDPLEQLNSLLERRGRDSILISMRIERECSVRCSRCTAS